MEKSDEKVKTLTDIIGEWGRWQRHFFIFVFAIDFISAFNNMGYTFYAYKNDFWCDDVPEDFTNKTEAMKCYKFSNLSEKCTKWRYDYTIMESSIVTAFDLVCDRSVLGSLTQTIYMLGYMLGGSLFTHLSDVYGRRPIIWICISLEVLACTSCGLSVNITQYIISRFVHGAAAIGKWTSLASMEIELTGPKHRSTIILVCGSGWVIGYVVLPGVALWLKHFRHIQLLTSAALFVSVLWYYVFYESPRWQISKSKFTEAEYTIRKALKANGKSDDGLNEKMNQLKENILMLQEKEVKGRRNVFSLLRTPNLRKYTLIIWYSIPVQALIYYGISYNIGGFGGNFHMNFMLSGLVEVPSQLVCIIGLKYLGRKMFTIIFLIIVAVSSLGMIPDNSTSRVIFALIGKFGISTSWWGISMLKSELYPTVLRTTGNGAATIVGRIGAIIAPFIKDFAENTSNTAVFIIYCLLSIVNTVLMLFLPETKGNELPDTLIEVENYGKNLSKNLSKNVEITNIKPFDDGNFKSFKKSSTESIEFIDAH